MNKMRSKLALASAIGCVLMLSSVTTVSAQKKGVFEQAVVKAKSTPAFQAAGAGARMADDLSAAEDVDGMYIVRLADRPIATYDGGIPGLAATSAQANGQRRLDTNSRAAQAYQRHLQDRQQTVLASAGRALGRSLVPKFQYQHAFNGFAIELTADAVKTLRRTDGVADVQRERIERPMTDAGPEWIGAPAIWHDGPAGTMGEGVVVAVLDTGINHDHPSFADIGGDGYDHENPLGSGNYIPGSYCAPFPDERELINGIEFCNDKLIGAWSFVEEPITPEDSDGHGSHTASTVAGNVSLALIDAPTLPIESPVSGVAPHANIIAYDVCVDDCPGGALLAAVEQVLVDAGNLPNGIAALNYSISGGGNPYNDPVEMGFLAAVAAGVYVSASAGNAGPGASTVAHLGPWVSTTAASTHNRTYPKRLVELSSDGRGKRGKPRNLHGRGATIGLGPLPIIHANTTTFDPDGQCLDPFPPGTFNGEIVVCDRGTIARVDKGLHVLLGGAAGFILANMAGNGESTNGDAHYLPAIHVGFAQAEWLRGWLADNTNTAGTIGPFEYGRNVRDGDIMADFSSRGPQTAFDVLKPDLSAPGVDVLAAVNSTAEPLASEGAAEPPPPPGEYGFSSGTSMSSPHNAGAGALMMAMYQDLARSRCPECSERELGLTPQEIKSVMMLTGESRFMRKEDAATPADPFDMGAGRISLEDAINAHMVMYESIDNFLEANPDVGGDPSTLNLASMMNSNCVLDCMWTRRLTNSEADPQSWQVSTKGDVPLRVEVVEPGGPRQLGAESTMLVLGDFETKEINVYADTTLLAPGWYFSQLVMVPSGSKGPTLRMPIAVYASTASNPRIFTKTVDKPTAAAGDTLTYELTVSNGTLPGPITVTDAVPDGATFVPGSATESVVDGITTSPWAFDGGTLSWTGELTVSGMVIEPVILVPGFLPLGLFGIGPVPCPSSCDEGGYGISDLDIWYNGEHYTTGIWSVNGTLELGQASGVTSDFVNTPLPNPAAPNNLLAPWWTDLNLGDGGTWSLGALTDGVAVWDIFEWNEAPDWGTGGTTANSFQIWLERGTENITFTYGHRDETWGATVGVENSDGSDGFTYYFIGDGTRPTPDEDLGVFATAGGSATLGFQVSTDCAHTIINQANLDNIDAEEVAVAVTSCEKSRK